MPFFFENVDLGYGYPKKRHLAQFPIAIEAAAAKLQTRKAHSHAALEVHPGSSPVLQMLRMLIKQSVQPSPIFTSFMGGINGINHQYMITYGWMIAGR